MTTISVKTGSEWNEIGRATNVSMPEPMRLTKRNDGERDFPEWFHQAMMANELIAHGMGKFGEGTVCVEAKNRRGEPVMIYEGDLFAPDSDRMTFDIVQKNADRDDA